MKCKICYNEIDKPFLSLGNSPLANSNITKNKLYEKEEYYPLDVYLCNNCKLVQVGDYVSSNVIFSPDYVYFSSYSKTWNEHCKNYVDMIVKRLDLNERSNVIEIGSNDGCLLQHFKPYNIPVIGVDPATETCIEASKRGIETHKFFFNSQYVKKMSLPNSKDLIIGNNVLAHNPDLNDFVSSMKYILKENGVITIEFPHLLNLIEHNQFDTIYHEHFSYFSLNTANILFKMNGLKIFDVEKIPTHGGSLRIYAKHDNDTSKNISLKIEKLLNEEQCLQNIETYHKFKSNVEQLKRNILKLLIELKEKNKKIIGYGAPAKGNTLLNYCGIGRDFIDYTVDLNPHKQGKYLPGTHIPIKSPDIIKNDKPDYIIILPWNIKDEIMKQLEYTKEWNCKLITLIPKITFL